MNLEHIPGRINPVRKVFYNMETPKKLTRLERGASVFVINQEGHADDFTNWILLEETRENNQRIRRMQQVLGDGTITDRIEIFNPDDIKMVSDKF